MFAVSGKLSLCRPALTILMTHSYRTRPLCGILIAGHRCRQFSQMKFRQNVASKLKLKDKVPEEYELIYRAPMVSYVYLTQISSTVSMVVLGILGTYILISSSLYSIPLQLELKDVLETEEISSDTSLPLSICFFVVFNIGICAITLRYPLRIYHNRQTASYICIVNGFLPTFTKTLVYHAGAIKRRVLPSFLSVLLPWRNSLFKVQKKTIFLMENGFRTPADLYTMLAEV